MEKRQKVYWILGVIIAIIFSVAIYNNLSKVESQKPIIFPEEADKVIIFGDNGEQYILNSTLLLEISTFRCNGAIDTGRGSVIENVTFTVAPDNKTITSVSCEQR